MTKEPWKPRPSSTGYYWACSQRAAFDRGIHEGLVEPSIRDDDGPKPHAALGTVIHFRYQDGLRAKFPGPSKDFAPTEEEYSSAATLFGGDRVAMMAVVDKGARLAVNNTPALPNGVYWLAEPEIDCDGVPGHIDLLASDNSIFIDLKTTRLKPTKMKREALVQMARYHRGCKAPYGLVIYLDSQSADWCIPIPIDFTKDDVEMGVVDTLPRLMKFWTGDRLYDEAYPGPLNDACGDTFCPYTRVCRDAIVPRADPKYNRRPIMPMGGVTL